MERRLSAYVGRPVVRLARTEREGDGVDRGRLAGATLVSTGSLEALRDAAGESGPVDGRRFRMTIGIDGVDPHAEDGWIGRRPRRRRHRRRSRAPSAAVP